MMFFIIWLDEPAAGGDRGRSRRPSWITARRNFFGSPLSVYETPEERSVHVAHPFDFELAEFLLRRR